MARQANVSATSSRPGCEARKVINGVTRNEEETLNLWQSAGIGAEGETLSLQLKNEASISQIRLTFDPDLSEERCISVSKAFLDKEPIGVAKELVKDYNINIKKNGEIVWTKSVYDNYQRQNIIDLEQPIVSDQIDICITATNGDADARVFEVRVYADER